MSNRSLPNDPAVKFLDAVRGIKCHHVAAALNTLTPTVEWSGCSKERMAAEYRVAMTWGTDTPTAALGFVALRSLDVTTLALRANAHAEGRADWASVRPGTGEAEVSAPTTAEIAAEVFKDPVLAAMRHELHDVSRSLLRTEDKLRAAKQRVKDLQERNAALVALVEQAAVPGGISEHEFSRPGGWRDRALCLASQA